MLIYLYGKAIIFILGIDNIFSVGHKYKQAACSVYKAIKYSMTWIT